MADRWATWIVVIALVSAFITYVITGEILRSVTILVVFCPCALVLATSTAIVAAIGNATKHGFLVKEGDALERLAGVEYMAFDKTGTLTYGKPTVERCLVCPTCGLCEKEVIALAAAAEARSEHPLGKAIVSYARQNTLEFPEPVDFEMIPGQGVRAVLSGFGNRAGGLTLSGTHTLRAGSLAFMEAGGISKDVFADIDIHSLTDLGCTITYLAWDTTAIGVIALTDTIRPDCAAAVAGIRSYGPTSVLLTGDNESCAKNIARQTEIAEYHALCRPEDKLEFIKEKERQGSQVAMVGDGVNDALALQRSFVGIAMGGIGSDIAIDVADIVMSNDCLTELVHLVGLSRKTMRKIKANLSFSMTLNFVAIVLAIIAVLDPVTGALVHNCGSVFVIVNSAFLLRWKRSA